MDNKGIEPFFSECHSEVINHYTNRPKKFIQEEDSNLFRGRRLGNYLKNYSSLTRPVRLLHHMNIGVCNLLDKTDQVLSLRDRRVLPPLFPPWQGGGSARLPSVPVFIYLNIVQYLNKKIKWYFLNAPDTKLKVSNFMCPQLAVLKSVFWLV